MGRPLTVGLLDFSVHDRHGTDRRPHALGGPPPAGNRGDRRNVRLSHCKGRPAVCGLPIGHTDGSPDCGLEKLPYRVKNGIPQVQRRPLKRKRGGATRFRDAIRQRDERRRQVLPTRRADFRLFHRLPTEENAAVPRSSSRASPACLSSLPHISNMGFEISQRSFRLASTFEPFSTGSFPARMLSSDRNSRTTREHGGLKRTRGCHTLGSLFISVALPLFGKYSISLA